MLASGVGLGAAALSGGVSLSAMVRTDNVDWWRLSEVYAFSSKLHVDIPPDDWFWQSDEDYNWHEREGRADRAHGERGAF
jgi:hypothetical protein